MKKCTKCNKIKELSAFPKSGGNGNRQDNRPENLELWTSPSKKDPKGVRMVDKVIDMLSNLTKDELEKVQQALLEKTK